MVLNVNSLYVLEKVLMILQFVHLMDYVMILTIVSVILIGVVHFVKFQFVITFLQQILWFVLQMVHVSHQIIVHVLVLIIQEIHVIIQYALESQVETHQYVVVRGLVWDLIIVYVTQISLVQIVKHHYVME
jgi:hypothetical protein